MKKTPYFIVLLSFLSLQACTPYSLFKNTNPTWMEIDSSEKRVKFNLVAAWDGSNNGFNYNGYYAGNLTLKVPDGWKVDVEFINRDASAAHNIIVTKPYVENNIPEYVGSEDAVLRRAYTEDLYVGEQETMHFIAKAGLYWFFCGINGHGINDMWINFEVSKTLSKPEIEIK